MTLQQAYKKKKKKSRGVVAFYKSGSRQLTISWSTDLTFLAPECAQVEIIVGCFYQTVRVFKDYYDYSGYNKDCWGYLEVRNHCIVDSL